MKICLISNLFPPIYRGGAEKVAKTVTEGLKSVGHEVFVISTKPWSRQTSLKNHKSSDRNIYGSGISVAEEDGVRVYRFYPLNFYYYLSDYKHNALVRLIWRFFDVFNFHSRHIVKKILKQEKPDLVVTHNLVGIGFLIPGLVRTLKIKHIHTLHDVQLSVPSGLIIRGQENSWQQKIFLRKWYETICRRLFGSPDVIISPSKWLMNFYTEKGFFKNSKKIILPNPVTGSRYPIPVNQRYRVSAELSLLYLGQIEEHKGILFLVNVLKKLDFDFKLHIAGDGSKLEEVKREVANDRRFVVYGKLSSKEVAKIFEEIDLTIVPSLCYENSPTVIYESLSFGVPVLAAKIGGVAELVHDGENGFTFLAGSPEDLVRTLKYCATHRDKLKKMRQSAQKSVEGFYIENYISKFLSL